MSTWVCRPFILHATVQLPCYAGNCILKSHHPHFYRTLFIDSLFTNVGLSGTSLYHRIIRWTYSNFKYYSTKDKIGFRKCLHLSRILKISPTKLTHFRFCLSLLNLLTDSTNQVLTGLVPATASCVTGLFFQAADLP